MLTTSNNKVEEQEILTNNVRQLIIDPKLEEYPNKYINYNKQHN